MSAVHAEEKRYCNVCRLEHRFFPLSYTVRHAGRLIGIGRTLAYEMASSGEIPVISVSGRTSRVPKDQFHAKFGGRPDHDC